MKDKQLILKTWNQAIAGAYYNTLIKSAKYIDENNLQEPKSDFVDDH